jgi:hypothetical protein
MSNTSNETNACDDSATNPFQIAFEGKTHWLADNLDVTKKLLRKLVDEKIIKLEHLLEIKSITGNDGKVDELLSILRRRDGRLFSTFCDILTKDDQQHVTCILRWTGTTTFQTSDKQKNGMEVELEEILELDYGLPSKLFHQ